MFILNLSSK